MIRDCPWCKYSGAMGPQCYGQAENKDCPNFVPSVDASQAFKNLDDAQSWIKYHYTELEVKLVELRMKHKAEIEQLNKDLAEGQNKILKSDEKITKLRRKLRQQKRGYKKTRVIPSLDPELQPRGPLWWGWVKQ